MIKKKHTHNRRGRGSEKDRIELQFRKCLPRPAIEFIYLPTEHSTLVGLFFYVYSSNIKYIDWSSHLTSYTSFFFMHSSCRLAVFILLGNFNVFPKLKLFARENAIDSFNIIENWSQPNWALHDPCAVVIIENQFWIWLVSQWIWSRRSKYKKKTTISIYEFGMNRMVVWVWVLVALFHFDWRTFSSLSLSFYWFL